MTFAPSSRASHDDDSSPVRQFLTPRETRLPSIPSGALLTQKVNNGAVSSQSSTDSRSTTTSSLVSEASSTCMYANPEQTLIFLDWDDTLFPTSRLVELFPDEMTKDGPLPMSDLLEAEMDLWREALTEYLLTIRQSCMRCTIVTNSRRPWVHKCIDRFHPGLWRVLEDDLQFSMRIVYANEEKASAITPVASTSWFEHCFGECLQGLRILCKSEKTLEDRRIELTLDKHAAMHRQASDFYLRYRNQTWKNILCVGDAEYEHDAVRTLSSDRKLAAPVRECLRTKTIRVPPSPSLKQLALTLKVAAVLHPTFVGLDGDLDLGLDTLDAMADAAKALGIPQLEACPMPFMCDDDSLSEEAAMTALFDLECVIRGWQEAAGCTQN